MTQPSPIEFLTVEEVAEVDRALLTSQDKFLTRIALYSLRALKQISQQTGQSIEAITPAQIEDWIAADEAIRQEVATNESFQGFFVRLVLSSLKPLHQISAATGVSIADLTIAQVIGWFEQEAKRRLEQSR